MSILNNEVAPPSLSPIRRRHWWVLNQTWEYDGIVIPQWFVTDFDTVPHIPFIFAMYKGRSRIAALIHDFLYALSDRPRKDIDELFYKHMLKDDVPKWIAWPMYIGVRAFGWRYFDRAVGDTAEEKMRSRMLDEERRVLWFEIKSDTTKDGSHE